MQTQHSQFEAGELRIEVNVAPEGVRLDWTGRSAEREPGKLLAPFFGDTLLQATTASAAVEMHFENLQHLNSSTINALIHFLRLAREAGVAVTLVFDPGLKWQLLSFEALRVFELPDGLMKLRPAGDGVPGSRL